MNRNMTLTEVAAALEGIACSVEIQNKRLALGLEDLAAAVRNKNALAEYSLATSLSDDTELREDENAGDPERPHGILGPDGFKKATFEEVVGAIVGEDGDSGSSTLTDTPEQPKPIIDATDEVSEEAAKAMAEGRYIEIVNHPADGEEVRITTANASPAE